ncbi:esterase-like activity of phytase family protein [Microlunatus parietis]
MSGKLAAGLLVVALAATGTAAPQFASAAGEVSFQRTATYPVYLNNGGDPAAETVAEISAVSEDGNTLIYTDAAARQIGFLDITDPHAPKGLGTLSLTELGDAEDEPTSVAVVGEYVLVVINTSASFTEPSGRLDVIKIADRSRVRSIELPGQPDSIAIAPDGSTAAIAIENERDEDAGDGGLPQQPAGLISFLRLAPTGPARWSLRTVEFADQLAGVPGIDTPEDPEPEYVAYAPDSGTVALTLQENNGIALFDPRRGKLIKAFTAGTVTISGVDTTEDGQIDPTGTITDVPREPDAIAWVDDHHVATANEGDWKGGSRGWTIFDARTGKTVWDAGNNYEQLAIANGLYPEDRSENKGTEPEGLAVAEFDGNRYGFVASERGNFVAVYDLADPAEPKYLQTLPTTNGPEGILPIPGRGLLAVSSEADDAEARVRASVSLFQLGQGKPAFPTIHSTGDRPIPWGALGALSPDVDDPSRLYTVTDAAYEPTRILGIDAAATPAVIDSERVITKNGAPYPVDAEGIAQRPDGSFWIAAEGETGPENALIKISADGAVQEEIRLPEDVAAKVKSQGFEGVAAHTVGGVEQVYVALQRHLDGDPEDTARIGRYTPSTGQWIWFGYPLERTSVEGDWIGLSELTLVDDHRLALIERDKLNGPDAAIKRVTVITLPDQPAATGLTALTKETAVDVLPLLRETNGWTQEKLEGLGIAGDGQVYAITDNDGVDDATGETVFLRLGHSDKVFGSAPDPSGSPTPSDTPSPSDSPGPSETPGPSDSPTPSTGPTPPTDSPAPSSSPSASPVPTVTPSPGTAEPSPSDGTSVPPPGGNPGGEGELPETGASIPPSLLAAALALIGGGALMIMIRRRAQRH